MKAHDGETDEHEGDVANDDGATDLVLVTRPSGSVHDDAGESVRWCYEALGLADVEVHLIPENDGQEVGKCIRDGGGVEEHHGVGPHLPVGTAPKPQSEVEFRHMRIASVAMDTAHDPVAFPLVDELECPESLVGEIDDEPIAGDSKEAGENTFDDEDPAPAVEAFQALHLHELWSDVSSYPSRVA